MVICHHLLNFSSIAIEQEMEEDNYSDEDQNQAQIDEQQNLKEKSQEQASQQESLKNQALKFNEYLEKFNQEFETSPCTTYFLLSKKWLKLWKKHVSYDRVIKGKEPIYQYFAKQENKLLNANTNLIQTTVQNSFDKYYEYDDLSQSGSTIILKPQLQESIDYIIVDRNIVNFFYGNYKNFKIIPRRIKKTSDGKKTIEIYYRNVNFVIINHALLRDIDNSKVKVLTHKKIQLFSGENQEELKQFLCPIIKQHQYVSSNQNFVNVTSQIIRLWKLNENDNPYNIYMKIYESTRKFTNFEYKLKTPFVFIERNNNDTIDDLNIIEGDTIIVEVQKNSGWTFILEEEKEGEQCEFCRNYKILKFECKCKKVKYCCENCKLKDQEHHARVYQLAYEETDEEEGEQSYKFKNDSIRGLGGLQNLGNTSFMNSILQCMSNTIPLTKYFLKKIFLKEINEQNVLGVKGELAKQYGKFIKYAWTSNEKTFSPVALKQTIGKHQPMFTGYQQHDSNEFLYYILDGLHEDLNRVKQKKYTESIDQNGRPDSIVSKESWLNHMKRNQSQFKTKITCPDCFKELITFDPFLICSLPIPTTDNLFSSDQNNSSLDQKYESKDHKTSIYNCLKLFEKPEKLDEGNEWYCLQCKKHQKALQQIVIYRAPEILIFHLKRFKGGLSQSKITKVVDFLEHLDMTEFVVEKEIPSHYYIQDEEYFKDIYIHPPQVSANLGDYFESEFNDIKQVQTEFKQETNSLTVHSYEEQKSNNNCTSNTNNNSNSKIDNENESRNQKKLLYDLYAISNHIGSSVSGHYSTFAKNKNQWYCFDDSSVRAVSEDQLVSEAAYVLFYKRRN